LDDSNDSSRAAAAWWNSQEVCVLSDAERHLGHAIQFHGRWYAFDATRRNTEGTDFAFVGAFGSSDAARRNVEQMALRDRERLAAGEKNAQGPAAESSCDALWALALLVQSAVVYGEWALARRRIRKLLAMTQESQNSTESIEYAVRDLGKAVVRHAPGEIEQAMTQLEQELARARVKSATA
jgi:hypothetical protein